MEISQRTDVAPINSSKAGQAAAIFELLTSRQVAAMFRMSYKTLERHARDGKIPGHFVFNRWMFHASELDAWFKSELHSSCQSRQVN